jgi:putative transposase
MARPPRIIQPGQPLHIMQRGNNRCITFANPREFGFYQSLLFRAAADAQCAIHAFVLMSNHVHLLTTPASATGPACMMKVVSETYAKYYNGLHGRTGTLWEGRYRSITVDSDGYFFSCSRYIELNPLRAGLAGSPSRYRWSSYHQNAGPEQKTLVAAHPLYTKLGRTEAERRRAYRGMFDRPLDDEVLESIRFVMHHRPKPGVDSRLSDRNRRAREILQSHAPRRLI